MDNNVQLEETGFKGESQGIKISTLKISWPFEPNNFHNVCDIRAMQFLWKSINTDQLCPASFEIHLKNYIENGIIWSSQGQMAEISVFVFSLDPP